MASQQQGYWRHVTVGAKEERVWGNYSAQVKVGLFWKPLGVPPTLSQHVLVGRQEQVPVGTSLGSRATQLVCVPV